MVIAPTHIVHVHRPREVTGSAYSAPAGRFEPVPVAAGVHAVFQPLAGRVQQTPGGRVIEASAQMFVPSGTDIEPDDGVVLTAVLLPNVTPVGSRFIVKDVARMPPPWRTEVLLDRTDEEIPG